MGTHNDLNQLTQLVMTEDGVSETETFAYDANGTLTANDKPGLGTVTLELDFDNRLKKLNYPDATYEEHFYNGDGQRIRTRQKDGSIVRYVWSGDEVITAYDGAWAPTVTGHP